VNFGSKKLLFTIILEFEGTNSVSQHSASSPDAAFRKWARGLDTPIEYALTKDQAREVAEALSERETLHREGDEILGKKDHLAQPLTGMKNAWCVTASAGKGRRKFVLVNIIATDPTSLRQ
jgi:hypothetical protein